MDQVLDLGFAKFILGNDGIIRVVYLKGVEITLKEVEKGGDALKQLAQGKKRPLFVDARYVKGMSREARLHSQNPDSGTPVVKAVATLNKPVIKVMGELFIRFVRPPYPVRFFSDEADAIEWLRQYVE